MGSCCPDHRQVSVPRRGFRSLLPSPTASRHASLSWFQSPEGDSGLCYLFAEERVVICIPRFSPPKGIQVFATKMLDDFFSGRRKFQSPEGDSGLCYVGSITTSQIQDGASFSPPKGIQVFATSGTPIGGRREGRVSVPRRGFRSLLRAGVTLGLFGLAGFSPPKEGSTRVWACYV